MSGSIDLTDIAAGTGGFVLRGGFGGDAGRTVGSAGDINGDGFADLLIGARTEGVAYVVFGTAAGYPSTINLADLDEGTAGLVIGQRYQAYGAISGQVAAAGDVNGDGFDDLILGAPYESRGRLGSAYVVFGRAGEFPATIDTAAIARGEGGFLIRGDIRGDSVGYAVAAAGDLNGDGFDDVVLGGFRAAPNAGNAYVVFGTADGFPATVELRQVAQGRGGFAIRGEDPGDQAGIAVGSAGDINGDGFGDLVVGAPDAMGPDNTSPNAGAAYIVFGTADGFPATIDLAAIAEGVGGFVLHGSPGDSAGISVAPVGDQNGDGIDDLAVGASSSGSTYVVFGSADGFPAAVALADVAAGAGGFVIRGEPGGVGITPDFAGRPVASAGDVNGDGFHDLIIGARRADGVGDAEYDAGAAYVVFGRRGGTLDTVSLVDVAQGQGGFVIHGERSRDQAGAGAAGAGDIDGDGFDDLIVGAYRAGTTGQLLGSGSAYVIFGSAFLGGAAPTPGTDAADSIAGTDAADRIDAGAGRDRMAGNGGHDTLAGGDGNDRLRGNGGDDVLAGGRGDDTLAGGLGADTLAGGQGADTFRFLNASQGADFILDFAPGADVIELAAAGFGLTPGEDLGASGRFAANAEGQASGAVGQFVFDTDDAALLWDADGGGAGAAVLIARFDDPVALAATDLRVIA